MPGDHQVIRENFRLLDDRRCVLTRPCRGYAEHLMANRPPNSGGGLGLHGSKSQRLHSTPMRQARDIRENGPSLKFEGRIR